MKRKKCARGGWPLVDRLESRSYLSGASFSGPVFVTGVDHITGMAAGDLTGNGQDDIVVAGQTTGTTDSVVAIYLSTGGTFSTPKTLIPINGATGGVGIGDFLGNGHQDVAVVDTVDNTLDVLLNDGAGNLSQGVGAGLGGTGGDTSLAVGDFNHDGKQDVAVVDPSGNAVNTYISAGDQFGRFVGGTTVSVPSPSKVLAADLNGDGAADLVILSSAGPNSIYVAINNGNDTFATPVQYSIGANIQSINDIAVARFNGGGLPSIVGLGIQSGSNAGVAGVLLNQGNGTFAAPVPITVASGAMLAVTGAFSGSGNQDIASISGTGALDVVPGDGSGGFGLDQSVFTTQLGTPGTLTAVGDFDADGRLDIAFNSSSGGFGVLLDTAGTAPKPPLIPPSAARSPLTPTLVTAVPTSPVVAGVKLKPLREKVVLNNAGTTTISGPVTLSLLLSPNTAGSTVDAIAATLSIRRLVLKAHKTKTEFVTIKSLPASATGSFYMIALVTDPAKLQNFVASSNTFSAVPAFVDLSGSFTSLPKSIKLDHPITVGFNVTNAGTVPATGRLEYKVYLSATGSIDANAVLIADVNRPRGSIRPGKPLKIRLNKTIKQAPAENYFVIVQLDPKNVFSDTNIANNTIISPQPTIPLG